MEKRVELEVRAKSPYRLEISINTNGLTSIGADFGERMKDMLSDYVDEKLKSAKQVQDMIRELAEICLAGIDECVEAGAIMTDEDQAIVCETRRKLYGSKAPITEADAKADLEGRPRPDNPSEEATKKQNFEAEASERERLLASQDELERKFNEFMTEGMGVIACPCCKVKGCILSCVKILNQ